MTGRLRVGLGDRTGIGVLAASAVLALALAVVPELEPWSGRAAWVMAWGIAMYLTSVALKVWPAPHTESQPPPQAAQAEASSLPQVRPALERPAAPRDSASLPAGLTAREVEVLRLLAAGNTNREIAAALTVSIPTAERHIANIYAKIGARGRADATAYALRHGLAD